MEVVIPGAALRVGDFGFEPRSGIQVSKKQNANLNARAGFEPVISDFPSI